MSFFLLLFLPLLGLCFLCGVLFLALFGLFLLLFLFIVVIVVYWYWYLTSFCFFFILFTAIRVARRKAAERRREEFMAVEAAQMAQVQQTQVVTATYVQPVQQVYDPNMQQQQMMMQQ